MSNALVAAGQSGPNFAQQGSVDWVSLSGSTLSFSLEVMSRFSKAGVEMITVAMGQVLFSVFKVPSAGQKRLSDAVSKLKAFSSYGNVLWFGFGIKHIVRTLCETEQGATCAGICACLSVSYDSFFASKVLKALADDSMAPNTLTPALSQWGALMNVCAGSVTDSTFPNTVEGFSRLLGQPSRTRKIPPLYEPTTSKALAGALLELAKVSNGSLRSVTFQGGIDCAWIAAVSQWLLNLRVQIIGPSGDCLYSNVLPNSDLHAQVIIIQIFPGIPLEVEPKALSRSYFVPSGQLCFSLLDEAALGDASHPHLFSKGRTEWDTILHSAFGWAADELLQPKHADRLATFLCFGFAPPSTKASINRSSLSSLTPWGVLSIDTSPQIKRAFLSFAAVQLPELKHLLHSAIPDVTDKPNIYYKQFPGVLAEICPCNRCDLKSMTGLEGLCLERVGFTIWRYLWTLSSCDLHPSIKPSPSGLLMLYYTHTYKDDDPMALRTRLWQRGINHQLISLFNGLTDKQKGSRAVSALSEGGICIFYHLLKDLEVDPFQIVRHTIVPGQIERGGSLYRQVSDMSQVHDVLKHPDFTSVFLKNAADMRWRLIAEETLVSNTLEASFEIMNKPVSSEPPLASAHTDRGSDSGQQQCPGSSWGCISVGITAMRTRILEKVEARHCQNRRVNINIPVNLCRNFSTWTGKCSRAITAIAQGEERIAKYSPELAEWVLKTSFTDKHDVLRGSNLLIYSLLSQLNEVAYRSTALVYIERCFLDAIGKPRSVTMHSIIDKVPSVLKLMESIEWISQEEQEDPSSPSSPSSSSEVDVQAIDLRKRAFYETHQAKDLEGFLERRGIDFLDGLTKDDLVISLEDDDIRHPDAAAEDGFIDVDLEGSDVVMDDVV